MPAILQNKKVLVLIAVFAIIVLWLLVFGGSAQTPAVSSSPAAPFLSVSPVASADAVVGQDLLAALALLKTIQLDTSVFADPIFKSLSDWGKAIPPQPVGRRNPFAPLGVPRPAVAVPSGTSGTKTPATKVPSGSVDTATSGTGDAEVWDFSDIEFSF
ncbi:MAG: hypothetical protein Q8R17_01120 [bacterium]|nr:hypothetical protein [bacterium]